MFSYNLENKLAKLWHLWNSRNLPLRSKALSISHFSQPWISFNYSTPQWNDNLPKKANFFWDHVISKTGDLNTSHFCKHQIKGLCDLEVSYYRTKLHTASLSLDKNLSTLSSSFELDLKFMLDGLYRIYLAIRWNWIESVPEFFCPTTLSPL